MVQYKCVKLIIKLASLMMRFDKEFCRICLRLYRSSLCRNVDVTENVTEEELC